MEEELQFEEEQYFGYVEPEPQKPAWWPIITAGIFFIICLIVF